MSPERFPLEAFVFARPSTNEWVLDITGSINDVHFTCRHTTPLSMDPAEVPGLPNHYDLLEKSLQALVSTRDFILKTQGTSNPARDLMIAKLCQFLDVEVVPT
jgi:hypothetical protein